MTSLHWPEGFIQRYPLALGNLTADTFSCGEGWRAILTQLFDRVEGLLDAMPSAQRPHVIKINETFGGLCIHMSEQFTVITQEIAKAELLAATTCEICGAPGVLGRPKDSKAGQIRVRCPECYESKRLA